MAELTKPPSDFDLHCLFEACSREAQRIGGDERTAEYFFIRAQSSRVWLFSHGEVTVADMDIQDWCAAIAWSAPGIGRPPKRAKAALAADTQRERKQPRSGAKYRRTSQNEPTDAPVNPTNESGSS